MSTPTNLSAALAALATTDAASPAAGDRDRTLAAIALDQASSETPDVLERAIDRLRPPADGSDPVRAAFLAGVRANGDDATASIVVAASRAAGSHYGPSDGDVEAAAARGIAVATVLEQVLGEALTRRGWWPPGVIGPLAGAVAVARLAGLDEARASAAIGIAATQGAGLEVAAGTSARAAGLGTAAAAAVEAVVLADHGFSGPPQGVDGRRGLLPTLFDGVLADPVRVELERRLGTERDSSGR